MINKIRYSLYEKKNLNSKILFTGSNKSEIKKVRTGWKNQMLFTSINAEIYDNDKQKWVI